MIKIPLRARKVPWSFEKRVSGQRHCVVFCVLGKDTLPSLQCLSPTGCVNYRDRDKLVWTRFYLVLPRVVFLELLLTLSLVRRKQDARKRREKTTTMTFWWKRKRCCFLNIISLITSCLKKKRLERPQIGEGRLGLVELVPRGETDARPWNKRVTMFSTTQKLSTFYSRKKIWLGLRPGAKESWLLKTRV